MKKDREFENILDECLEKMLRGTPIEQCLADYPDHAAALEPMLRTAFRAKTATNIHPHPEFKDRARHQFQAAIRETAPAPAKVRRGFFPSSLRPAWVTLAALVAVIIAGGGTVYAAGNALPDSPLYAVKLATESVRLFLTPSDIGKAELYAQFADERIEEIIEMADKGEAELAQQATDRLNTQLVAMVSLTIDEKSTPTGGDTFALEAADSLRYGEEEASAEVTVPQTTVAAVAPATTPAPGTPITAAPSAAIATAPDKDATQGTADVAPAALPATVPPLTDIHEAENYSLSDDDLEREKLKELLLRRAIENPDALRAALETAPESLKDILRWAIEVADASYDEAISNLR